MSNSPRINAAIATLARSIAQEYAAAKSSAPEDANSAIELLSQIEQQFKSTLRAEMGRLDTALESASAAGSRSQWASEVLQEATKETLDFASDAVDGEAATAEWTPVGQSDRSSRTPPADAVLPPEYEELGVLGKGGMGIVYKARHRPLNRLVAIKMILVGAHASKSQQKRFEQEAQAVAKLSHPNIVSVFEVSRFNGLPFLSLEFVRGTTMSRRLRDASLTSQQASEWMVQICHAVHYSHEQGILHRDLKPQNILITDDGVPKITDFGLAKRLAEAGEGDIEDQTKTGEIVGTPGFMAPEQARGDKSIGAQADVYALGAILYSALTGRAPFIGPTPYETIRQVIAEEPLAPSKLQPHMSRDLETICLKCLEKDPEKRYRTAGQLANEIQCVLDGKPIQARPITLPERCWKWCRRNPKVATLSGIAAGLLLCLLLGGVGSAVLIHQQQVAEKHAKEEAIANAELAEDQALVARDTTRAVLYQTRDFFDNRPELNPLREQVLDKILAEIEKVHQRHENSTTNETFRASAIAQLGQIYLEVGKAEQALEKLLDAESRLNQLRGSGNLNRPDVSAMRLTFWIGDAHRALDHYDDAEKCYLKNITQREAHFEKYDQFDDLVVEQSMAEVYGRLARLYLEQGNSDKAEPFVKRSVDARRQGFERMPNRSEAMGEYAGSLGTLSELYERQGRIAEMIQTETESLELFKKLASQNRHPATTYNLVLKQRQLAERSMIADLYPDAEPLLRDAMASLESLKASGSKIGRIDDQIAACLYLKGVFEDSEGRDSSETYDRAASVLRSLIEESRTVDRQGCLLKVLSRSGQVDQAMEIANQFAKQETSLMHSGYAAVGLGLISEHLQGKEKIDAENRAVALTQRLIRLGWTDIDALRTTDLDFEPLRKIPEFNDMLDQADAAPADLAVDLP
ncbi:serine/threonine-protein kinase [Novipirellula artificiosorum]|uniref:non-specific serine/threonine protein kinase n=1 Tax=Novipirellula artificiosorum TaxID=2528016 RepID=A0A5C6E401_9BACT|nr:serine/threonine-protein kinase [Novipirellula artificiosorum]TWU42311.1 Serine/threonine-protein kinase PknB [Novipirellula artificiosorum]